jgi:hypothetical protein
MRLFQRSLFAIFAALCLLGVQQGAAWHQLSHIAQAENSYHAAGGHAAPQDLPQDKQDGQPHSKICDECSLYAGIAGGAVAASSWLHVADASAAPVSFSSDPHFSSSAPAAYAARAPPILL